MMSRCKQCNVEILDNTEKCPLCHHVLELDDAQRENMYPNARVVGRKYRMLENILLFASIVVFLVCFYINFTYNRNIPTEEEVWWSLILGLVLVYGNGLLRITILGKSDYLFKIIIAIFLALAVLLEVDWLTGAHGWGVNFVFPIAIICMDIAILILMLVNRRNWQSYLMVQIGALILGVIAFVLVLTDVITFPYLAVIAAGFALFVFLGTGIIGDQKARTELKRRFHI